MAVISEHPHINDFPAVQTDVVTILDFEAAMGAGWGCFRNTMWTRDRLFLIL